VVKRYSQIKQNALKIFMKLKCPLKVSWEISPLVLDLFKTNLALKTFPYFLGPEIKKKKETMLWSSVVFKFFFSHVAPKVSIESQENLAKSGYKTNREIKKKI
jgi:cellulose synthase/poly-beta-1,6-N-acetylglucosamine synthase-like glycosyltransferase